MFWAGRGDLSQLEGGSEVKASACNAGDLGSILGSGRSPGEGNGNPLQVFLPGESHGRRSPRWATVHGTKSRTRLSDFTFSKGALIGCAKIAPPIKHLIFRPRGALMDAEKPCPVTAESCP